MLRLLHGIKDSFRCLFNSFHLVFLQLRLIVSLVHQCPHVSFFLFLTRLNMLRVNQLISLASAPHQELVPLEQLVVLTIHVHLVVVDRCELLVVLFDDFKFHLQAVTLLL